MAPGVVPEVLAAVTSPNGPPAVVPLSVADLPSRVEAWGAIDRLVWQDVESSTLNAEQLVALRAWLGAGGRLVVLGGSTGGSTLSAFADGILPYRPDGTVDVPAAELVGLVGALPDTARPVTAIGGASSRGTILARAGHRIVAAEAPVGSGSVTLVGFDPTVDWLRGGRNAEALWRRILPTAGIGSLNPLSLGDDSQIVTALNNLPAVQLPPIEQLFVLLLAYIALVGPINYLVLRRIDRREWAWLTMPALVAVFAVASYALGASIKGTDIVVNELAVVHAAVENDRGVGQVYVGVFSPTRRQYEVQVPNGALLSNPVSQLRADAFEQPLDVITGEPSRLRNYLVGANSLRGFRAETVVSTPRIEARMTFSEGRLRGEITNRSDVALEVPAVVLGDGVAVMPTLAPGQTHAVDVAVTGESVFDKQLSQRILGVGVPTDAAAQRQLATRRAVIDQLTQYGDFGRGVSSIGGDGPMLVAWRPTPAVGVQLAGEKPNNVGETLLMWPLPMSVSGPATFPAALVRSTLISSDTADGGQQGENLQIGRGTMTVDYRPISSGGTFRVSKLAVSLNQGDGLPMGDPEGAPVQPLTKQPDQDDPVGPREPAAVPGDGGMKPEFDGLPEVQLFDRVAGRWMEFAPFTPQVAREIANPERYVDSGGSVLVRFVNRSEQLTFFRMQVRLEGEVV